MNGVNISSSSISKNSNQNVLFNMKGPRIESEFKSSSLEEDFFRKSFGHEIAEWNDGDLSGD